MTEQRSELARILGLPRRPVLDCERGPDRRWSPEAEALIRVVNARYSRGERLSCACRDRVVDRGQGDALRVYHTPSPGQVPPLPLETTIGAFLADNAHAPETVQTVRGMRAGERRELRGLGYPFCGAMLNPAQAWALRELATVGGVFGMVSVGFGKTWIGILAPLALPRLRTWAIFITPSQRLHYAATYLRLREHYNVPSIVFDRTMESGSYIVQGAPTLHVIPYSLLSNQKSTMLLYEIDPDGLIADEAHNFANPTAARTLRVFGKHGFMVKRNAEGRPVVFCNWSGSTVKKSMKDCSHLSAFSLGTGSPYPIPSKDVDDWSAVIDPSFMPDSTSSTAAALRAAFDPKVAQPAAPSFLPSAASNDGIREGHRDWVIRTPGVVSTRSSSITCSITIRERRAPAIPPAVRAALAQVRAGERPDGDIIEEAAQVAMVARQVASGFFTYWAFRKETPDDLIKDWFDKRKLWCKAVRARLLYGEPHLDSPDLLWHAAERAWRTPRYDGPLPVWPEQSWPAWAEIKDRVPHDERVRWIGAKTQFAPAIVDKDGHVVGEYLAWDAAQWARENRGVVWCASRALGLKIASILDVPYHAGGDGGEALLRAEDGSRSVVCSLGAVGYKGFDGLQLLFHRQLLCEIPASGDGFEQVLGRLAREGQREDCVETDIYRHVEEIRDAFRQAVMYAKFIEGTTPNRQALLAADIDFSY